MTLLDSNPHPQRLDGSLTKRSGRLLAKVSRILIGLVVAILLLAGIGSVYQTIGTSQDAQRFQPPGIMIDMGGYQMHIYCQGEGSPTVLVEALSGGSSSYYAWIQPELAAHTRVCTYDRAGRAWSQSRPFQVEDESQQTAVELHTLLQKAGISPPYVLAGHSIGGIYTRTYVQTYPDQIAGLVLIDSAHPAQFDRYPEMVAETENYLNFSSVFPVLARIGLFRLYFAVGGEIDFEELPPQQHAEVAALWSSPLYFASSREETLKAAQIYQQAQSLGGLGDLPLMVITASESNSNWLAMQNELVSLSSNSVHQVIQGATHVSLAFNPDHASQVSSAILEVVEAVRKDQPLVSRP